MPKGVLLENVPGLSSLYKGRIRDAIYTDLSSLGYTVTGTKLMATYYGVPQRRQRVFFVALCEKAFSFPTPTHSEPSGLSSEERRFVTCEEAISDLPLLEDELGEDFQRYPVKPMNQYQELMREGSSGLYNHVAAEKGASFYNRFQESGTSRKIQTASAG